MELMSSSSEGEAGDSDSDLTLSPRSDDACSPRDNSSVNATVIKLNTPVSKEKPVISARELLLKLLPAGKRRKSPVSAGRNAKEAAMEKAVDAYSFLSPRSSLSGQKDETKLSASERIARKYGLKARAERGSSRLTNVGHKETKVHAEVPKKSKVENDFVPKKTVTTAAANSEVKSKKRTFWEAQTADAGSDNEDKIKTTYVSPFRSPGGFKDMKKRRQRQQEQEELGAGNVTLQGFKHPQHVLGSAIEGPAENDADDWFSDSKEMVSDDEEVIKKPVRSSVTSTEIGVRPQPSGKAQVPLQPRFKKRSRKEKNDSSGEHEDVDLNVEERWPQLPFPQNDINGPMVLSPQNENDTKRLEVCTNLNKFLLDYQREGVKFLYSAYQRRTSAILGDDMGLGKTIQVIALLSAILGKRGDRRDKDAWKALLHQRRERFFEGGGNTGGSGFSFGDEIAPIFIVVPASLLQNWEAELAKWMSCCTIILRGKPEDREVIIDQISR
ncbi:DNA excision repair protein ERCC-6-like 2 [Phytophthora boehmeriae]|uniref:DNA excision repair protein ERCC-6-like 2 n=1 Tax=Phytophthora boehmeriae TaxID=109152 RepID=A0A8T1WKF6_9STRA|nr:DNA excision repair protein ERCC-6-like 2 [Phytophthora boehmeriae]